MKTAEWIKYRTFSVERDYRLMSAGILHTKDHCRRMNNGRALRTFREIFRQPFTGLAF